MSKNNIENKTEQDVNIPVNIEPNTTAGTTPDTVIVDEDDDSDMPEPETKEYVQYIRCTDKFMELFYEAVGKLPYASVLKNNNGEQIKLISLVKYVETNKDKISVTDMNHIVSWIANLEFRVSRPLMEIIESQDGQKALWELIN